MFDVSTGPLEEWFNQDRLQVVLASMSDEELEALEDDLDFCNFAGVPSARVLSVLTEVIDLDKGWERQLKRRDTPSVPIAY